MSVELKITALDTGQITVDGPIDNLILCYGLLTVGMDVVRQRALERANAPTIQPASSADVIAINGPRRVQ